MSYYVSEKNNTKKLSKFYKFPHMNEQFEKLEEKINVIEVGFWISEIIEEERRSHRWDIDYWH